MTLKEIKNFDTITITLDIFQCRDFLLQNNNNISVCYFPLEEGVIKTFECLDKNSGAIQYVYFKEYEYYELLEFYLYIKQTYDFIHLGSIKITGLKDNNLEFKYNIISQPENTDIKPLVDAFTIYLSYICYIKDNPNVVIRKERESRLSNKASSNNVNAKNNYKIKLGEKVVYELKSSNVKSYKKRNRHTSSWQVMAFERHYKNGKTTMVKSHTRGKGVKNKKDYIV